MNSVTDTIIYKLRSAKDGGKKITKALVAWTIFVELGQNVFDGICTELVERGIATEEELNAEDVKAVFGNEQVNPRRHRNTHENRARKRGNLAN